MKFLKTLSRKILYGNKIWRNDEEHLLYMEENEYQSVGYFDEATLYKILEGRLAYKIINSGMLKSKLIKNEFGEKEIVFKVKNVEKIVLKIK